MLKGVTAVCVLCSDFMAMGVLKGLSELGYRVPEDISLIGYDDNPLGIYTIVITSYSIHYTKLYEMLFPASLSISVIRCTWSAVL